MFPAPENAESAAVTRAGHLTCHIISLSYSEFLNVLRNSDDSSWLTSACEPFPSGKESRISVTVLILDNFPMRETTQHIYATTPV